MSEPNRPVDVEDLTLLDARYLLEGIEAIYVGTPGLPERGDLTPMEEALILTNASAIPPHLR